LVRLDDDGLIWIWKRGSVRYRTVMGVGDVAGYTAMPTPPEFAQIRPTSMDCPRCAASPGEACNIALGDLKVVHPERIKAALAKVEHEKGKQQKLPN
jgi:hypothetical protein